MHRRRLSEAHGRLVTMASVSTISSSDSNASSHNKNTTKPHSTGGTTHEEKRGRFRLRRAFSWDDEPKNAPDGTDKQHFSMSQRQIKISFPRSLKSMLSSSSVVGAFNRPSPQQYFTSMLMSRGYSTETQSTLAQGSSYTQPPTPLQVASYGDYMTDLVRNANAMELQVAINCGLSPNPDNGTDESLLHLICRSGQSQCLQVLMDSGCVLSVADRTTGRTPLHEVCWAGHFEMFVQLVTREATLLCTMDARGCTPLSYIPQMQWTQYIDWIKSHQDSIWPQQKLDVSMSSSMSTASSTSSLPVSADLTTLAFPREQLSQLPLPLVSMIAKGRMSPSEISRFVHVPLNMTGTNENETSSSVTTNNKVEN